MEGILDIKAGNGPAQGILLLLGLRPAAHGSFEEVKLSVAVLCWLAGTAGTVVPIVRRLFLGSVRPIFAVVGPEAELTIAEIRVGDIELVADKLSADNELMPAQEPGEVVVDRQGIVVEMS